MNTATEQIHERTSMTTTTKDTNYLTATASAVTLETHKPGLKLTQDERTKNFDQHKYGLCVSCDTGLDDPANFTCDPRLPGGFALMCTACIDYYNKNGYVSCGYGPFSNAMMKR